MDLGSYDEMGIVLLKRLAVGYGVVLTLAAGGLAFANIFGIAVTAIQFGAEDAAETMPTRTVMHVGWVFGVCVALVGAIQQIRKRGWSLATHESASGEVNGQQEQPATEGAKRGVLVSAAWGSFFGAILGAALGVTFILLWFSIAYSPFAPKGWGASIKVERERVGASRIEEPVAKTRHPVALYAFGLPVALGVVGGAVFGGLVRVSDDH